MGDACGNRSKDKQKPHVCYNLGCKALEVNKVAVSLGGVGENRWRGVTTFTGKHHPTAGVMPVLRQYPLSYELGLCSFCGSVYVRTLDSWAGYIVEVSRHEPCKPQRGASMLAHPRTGNYPNDTMEQIRC